MFRHIACLELKLRSLSCRLLLTFVEISIEIATNESAIRISELKHPDLSINLTSFTAVIS